MTNFMKYPRTFHLPWSLGITNDDKTMSNIEGLQGEEVIITEKMDGENSTMRQDVVHARSLDSNSHVSREWVKNYWSSFSYNIPEGFRICGENMFAQHSIKYDDLISYFYGFSVWEGVTCLSWDETIEWFELLGIAPVNVIYQGVFNMEVIKKITTHIDSSPYKYEGYVVRVAREFDVSEFNQIVGKYVRENHVQTSDHWMHQTIVKNRLSI